MGGQENQSQQVEKSKVVEITKDYLPLTELKDGCSNIYVIVKSMDSSYWKVVLEGTKEAGIDKECNIYAAGSNLETEWQLQEAYLKLAVEQGADGIILGPDNSEMLSSAVEYAHEKEIPVVIVDTIVNSEAYDVCYMTDNLLAGEDAAKEMLHPPIDRGPVERWYLLFFHRSIRNACRPGYYL